MGACGGDLFLFAQYFEKKIKVEKGNVPNMNNKN
jgi:hypothetical protein